jgi:peptidoglycan hydrolase-like protein with peptidoglycan-binding domain
MKSLHYILFVSLLSAAAAFAQSPTTGSASASRPDSKSSAPKRGPVFRANKNQIVSAQTMLRSKGVYNGDSTGKLDPATRASIKSFQTEKGLAATGTLNRATLEKMGIELTEKQRAIPVSESSYASADRPKRRGNSQASDDDKPARSIFRATKEQIVEAQKVLRSSRMYEGEESGRLDDPTREGLKKYQEANGLKITGTLNQVTLEKMGVALTEKQKGTGGGPN